MDVGLSTITWMTSPGPAFPSAPRVRSWGRGQESPMQSTTVVTLTTSPLSSTTRSPDCRLDSFFLLPNSPIAVIPSQTA